MRPIRFALALVLGLFATTAVQADIVSLSFAGVDNAKIRITGHGSYATIAFVPGDGGKDFSITGASPPGDATSLPGEFVGDPGTLSFLKSDITLVPGGEVASPLTSNHLGVKIGDTEHGYLMADITSVSAIQRTGSFGLVNTDLVVNLTGARYEIGKSGTPNMNLSQFASPGTGTFQFSFKLGTTSLTLGDMTANGFERVFESYEGGLASVPEPGSLVLTALVAGPLMGLAYRRRRCKAA